MDLGLPDIDGINVTKQIRQNNTYYENIPIIALTAHSKEEIRKACLAAGINDFVTKPIDRDRIEEIINVFAPYYNSTLSVKLSNL